MNATNKFPYIIAVGEQKNDIKCFYIAIEQQIISVKSIKIIIQAVLSIIFLHSIIYIGANYIQIRRGIRPLFQASSRVQYQVSSEP